MHLMCQWRKAVAMGDVPEDHEVHETLLRRTHAGHTARISGPGRCVEAEAGGLKRGLLRKFVRVRERDCGCEARSGTEWQRRTGA